MIERVGILPDTHAPFHSERAWKLAMKVMRAHKPHTLVHMGDLADFFSVSSHSKDPTRVNTLAEELTVVRELRAEMDSLGAKTKIFIAGNHEDRLQRYLQDKAPELFGLVDADKLIELSVNGWKVVPYKQHTKLGKLHLVHDTGQGGKYTTTRALDTFQASVVIGHHHALQYVVMGDARGGHQVGAQFGWLGSFDDVDYMHKVKAKRNWAHACGVGWHNTQTGYVYLQPVPFVNGTANFNGKVYRA